MRRANCQCGQLTAECDGEPVRISVCHCLDCQRRSGSAFAAQAHFPSDAVRISGASTNWTRTGESGGKAVFSFCPVCGSQVHYMVFAYPDRVTIPLGAFADPDFPAPRFSVFENRKHRWVEVTGDQVEHD